MTKKSLGQFIKGLFTSQSTTQYQKDTPEEHSAGVDEEINTTAMAATENLNGFPKEFQYLKQLIHYRMNQYFPSSNKVEEPQIPNWDDWTLEVPDSVREATINEEEITLLLLALAPHIIPDLLDSAIELHLGDRGDFPKIGGVRGTNFRGFLPTGETALFLLGGDDLAQRFSIQRYFQPDHFFAKHQILWLDETKSGEPPMSAKIMMGQEYVDQFISGNVSLPKFGINFPARHITTLMEWEDLILPAETNEKIHELETWVKYGSQLLDHPDLRKKVKPGYRALFYGRPGTGKTLTASLLGKCTGKPVYKIDLSMVISKFIGETEKNLAKLFDRAENKDWILFFDEADALFGKRTNVRDAHDRYANQEVSYLLQRTEEYGGLVILATNFKSNIDEAFTRRFQSQIYFPSPQYSERLELWDRTLPQHFERDQGINLSSISRNYELTGANVVNVVQYACLKSLSKESTRIDLQDLMEGIRNEYCKEGKLYKS
ncbi:MAG: ATP-binding protein [Cyclobacteriaceae bacterium]